MNTRSDTEIKLSKNLSMVGKALPTEENREGVPLFLAPVMAGFPSPADDYVDQELDLHAYVVKNRASTFFLRAEGESMINAGIHDNDLLVVDRSLEAVHNSIVIAALDGELTVKRLVRKNGKTLLMPENDNFSPIDITEREYVHIWGVVSYVLHKF